MKTTRLSTKGQILVPKEIRDSRSWGPGTEFVWVETMDGVLLRPVTGFPRTNLQDVAGCLRYKGKPKTLAQMDGGIAREAARRHERGRY